VGRGGLLVFDAVYAGDDLPSEPGEEANVPWMRLPLVAGHYRIESAIYEPDTVTQLILHRLSRATVTGQES
jgi:hypothetical protein